MAQHDYVIANQSFPSTRTDINNALLAISSTNSGTSAPSTTYANQLWYDTTNNKLYIRNEDNDAWIPLFLLDQSNDKAGTLATEIDIEDSSGTNTAGTALTVKGGAGTGTGAGGAIIFQTADGGSSGSSVNSHATVVTITDDGKVGVGDATPETPIEISTANTLGGTFTGTTAGEGLRVSQASYSASNFVSLIEAPHQQGGVPNVRIGAMFDSGGSHIALGTSNSFGSGVTNTAMFIDEAGLIGIGTTSPSNATLDVAGRGRFLQDAAATTGAVIIRESSGGVGGHIQFVNNANDAQRGFISSNSSGDILLGGAAERMRMLSAGGLTFNGDTAAANALDDYEQGTFTPVFDQSGVAISGVTTNINTGVYTKIGNKVTIQIYLHTTAAGSPTSGTALTVGDLPFVGVNTANVLGTVTIGYVANFVSVNPTMGFVNTNTDYISLFTAASADARANSATMAGANLGSDTYLILSATYITN